MIRQHDVHVLAEGTFRVIMTTNRRVAAVIDVPDSALGPLHLMFEVTRPPLVLPSQQIYTTGGIFDGIVHAVEHVAHDVGRGVEHAARDVGHAAEHAADGAFNAAAKVATTVARPAFNLVRDAASSGAQLIAHAPFLPAHERQQLEAASRVIMRARLGDVTAKDFVRSIANAAKAGVEGARHAGDALLAGVRVVNHVLDAPLKLAERVPLLGGALHSLDPFQKMDRMTVAIQHGDFETMKKIVTDDARLAEGVVSLVPGIGSGIGAAIGTGLAILDGGGPLEIAVKAAYGAIPIPPGIRTITDAVLDTVLSLAHHGSITDAGLAAARNAVPSGLPRDVFDTLAQLVVKRVPVQRVAEALVDHYVKQYAPQVIPKGVMETVDHVTQTAQQIVPTHLVDAAQHMVPPNLVDAAQRAANVANHLPPRVVHVPDAARRLVSPSLP